MPQSWPPSSPQAPVLSKCSGRHIQMPAQFDDFLPGSVTHLTHMPLSSHQQCALQGQKSPSPIPPSPDMPESLQEGDLDLSFTTEPDNMGLYCTYVCQPTHIPTDTLHSLVDAPTLDSGSAPPDEESRPLHGPPDNTNEDFDFLSPFTNSSCGLLMAYQYSGTIHKSGEEIDRLPGFLNHLQFHVPDVQHFFHMPMRSSNSTIFWMPSTSRFPWSMAGNALALGYAFQKNSSHSHLSRTLQNSRLEAFITEISLMSYVPHLRTMDF